MKIGINIIATGKYDQFVGPILASIEKHFFKKDDIIVFLYTDGHFRFAYTRLTVCVIRIEHEPWPYITLHRYKHFNNNSILLSQCDYLFYCDVDMLFVADVGREILPTNSMHPLIAVRHPGFYSKHGSGSWEDRPESMAYTPMHNRWRYYAGGFQGGVASDYLVVCKKLSENIQQDEHRAIMARWHDESHWNAYLSANINFIELTPEYCMVEEMDKRIAWGIDHLQPKIIALSKNHKEFQV